MNTAASTTHASAGRLEHMPVSLFSIVMGLAGATVATEKVELAWGWSNGLSTGLLWLTIVLFVVIAVAYAAKFVLHRSHVMAEFNHPIRLSFFPAMSIGLLLLSIAVLSHHQQIAQWAWGVGTVLHLLFTLTILSNWIHHERFQIQHSNPAWFIPIVGNILIPVAGASLGWKEVSWFFFSIGIVMWLPLLAVLLNRFFFHPMMPAKMLPTLFILIPPPAVGFISWVKLHGGTIDDTARILYYFALFVTMLLAWQVRYFARLSFALPWWAYSFPLAAITIATSIMAEKVGGPFFPALLPILYTVLMAMIALLLTLTARAMMRHEICVPE
ncbi:MAG: SLAC1 anion channel family protein [Pseudomonadota bacterium]